MKVIHVVAKVPKTTVVRHLNAGQDVFLGIFSEQSELAYIWTGFEKYQKK